MDRRTLFLFTAINFLNYFDRYLVAPLLPILREEMSLSYEQGARLVSAFVFGYFLFSPLFGILGDRYNRPKLMFLGVALWSVATMATGLAGSFLMFLGIRIFVGIGEASFGTISPGFIKDREPDPVRLNRILSVFYTAIPVGAALAYVFAGQVATHLSWHYVFLFGGVPGLLLAPMLLLQKEQRTEKGENAPPVKEGLISIAHVPILLLAIGGYVFNSFALNGIAAFISELGKSIGFSLDDINLYFGAILVVSGFLGTIVGGRISASLAERSGRPVQTMLRFIGLTAVLATPFLFAVFFMKSKLLFLALCFIVETLVFAGTAPVNSVIVSTSPRGLVTLTQGVTIFLLNLFGALLGPWSIGLLADVTGLASAMQMTTAALFLSGILWIIGSRLLVPVELTTVAAES